MSIGVENQPLSHRRRFKNLRQRHRRIVTCYKTIYHCHTATTTI